MTTSMMISVLTAGLGLLVFFIFLAVPLPPIVTRMPTTNETPSKPNPAVSALIIIDVVKRTHAYYDVYK